jgi:hypothetical protein
MDKVVEKYARIACSYFPSMAQNNPGSCARMGTGSLSDSDSRDAIVPASFQWSLKTIRVLQPEIVSRLSGDTQLLAAVRLFRSGPVRIRKQQASGAAAFPPGERVISF